MTRGDDPKNESPPPHPSHAFAASARCLLLQAAGGAARGTVGERAMSDCYASVRPRPYFFFFFAAVFFFAAGFFAAAFFVVFFFAAMGSTPF